MRKASIGVFKIAQTRVNWLEVCQWLEFLGIPNDKLNDVLASVGHIVDGGTESDAAALIALGGKRCYNSFTVDLNPNVTRIREDLAEYVTNILRSGHGSVLEHASWTFAIENVSRVFTGEMNRHRAGTAISEGSMRYIRYDDVPYWEPDTITDNPIKDWLAEAIGEDDMSPEELDEAKQATRDIFEKSFSFMEQVNVDLSNVWKIDDLKSFKAKKLLTSMFRRVIGMGIASGGVWTMNARAMRHILTMRASTHAEEEIYNVFHKLATLMVEDEPLIFGDFEQDETGNWKPKFVKI